jgi:hypothetical protein
MRQDRHCRATPIVVNSCGVTITLASIGAGVIPCEPHLPPERRSVMPAIPSESAAPELEAALRVLNYWRPDA